MLSDVRKAVARSSLSGEEECWWFGRTVYASFWGTFGKGVLGCKGQELQSDLGGDKMELVEGLGCWHFDGGLFCDRW